MQDPVFRYKKLPIHTHRESLYLRVLNEILIKPEWWIKIKEEAVVDNWRQEARYGIAALLLGSNGETGGGQANAGPEAMELERAADVEPTAVDADIDTEQQPIRHVTDSEFVNQVVNFLFQELEYIAANRLIVHKNGGTIVPTSSHGVLISDNVVPIQTISHLARYAAAIEYESLKKNKWHEGSDEKVLDLIHPSDYCLVYRRSLKRGKLTQLIGSEPFQYTGITYGDVSEKFQWLPSEFKVNQDGGVEIRSYINNLNRRKHPEVQDAIKSIFESMVPMFERALGSFETQPENRIKASLNNNDYQKDQYEWQFDEYLRHKHGVNVNLKDQSLREAAEDDDELDEFIDSLWEAKRFRPVHIPGLPKLFEVPAESTVHTFNLNGRDLQVIVKMASIHLTPEKPSFT
ncbi:hypothetical protein HDU79_011256, partial [Rhizoclosmatium sp. JEL0117]